MSRYTLEHDAESDRIREAIDAHRWDEVALAADGTRKPVGRFTRADLDYWHDFLVARGEQHKRVGKFLEASANAVGRRGVGTPGELPAIELRRLRAMEMAIIRDLRTIAALPDIVEGPFGIEFLVGPEP